MPNVQKLLREPLVHFLLIGAALFLLFEITQAPGGAAPDRILVSAEQVARLTAQFKRTWLRPPTEEELSGLIDNFVRDEIYYREALAMGLNRDDPMIRRRMRQKLEFILEDLSAASQPDDQVLMDYLRQNADRFSVEPRVSFQQVYLNPATHTDLEEDAESVLTRLQAGAAPENIGDPTLVVGSYHLAFQSEIARYFGNAFAQQVAALEPGPWIGPLYSGLGAHLVQVTETKNGFLPELDEIRTRVARDYMAQRRRDLQDEAYNHLRENYEVVIAEAESGETAGNTVAAANGGKED
jgi:hypothetical protein